MWVGAGHPSGLTLRAITKDNEPWFVAADVCRALDLSAHPHNGSIVNHLGKPDADEVTSMSKLEVQNAGRLHHAKLVSESGVYALVMRSRKPEAQRFRKWVTSERTAQRLRPSPAVGP